MRGEGAVLLNENGERFTDELQPRDVVTEAICKEMDKFGTDHVYITLPTMTSEQAQKDFRTYLRRAWKRDMTLQRTKFP